LELSLFGVGSQLPAVGALVGVVELAGQAHFFPQSARWYTSYSLHCYLSAMSRHSEAGAME